MTKLLTAIFLTASVMASTTSFGGESQVVSTEKAVLTFCPKGAQDCGGTGILINGKGYRAAGATEQIQDQLSAIAGAYQFHNMTRSLPFAVMGYLKTVQSNGGFGPPQSVVFFITSNLGSVAVPK